MEDNALFLTKRADFLGRLDSTDLVIDRHNAYDRGIVIDKRFQLVKVNNSVSINADGFDFKAVLFQIKRGVEDRAMLDA